MTRLCDFSDYFSDHLWLYFSDLSEKVSLNVSHVVVRRRRRDYQSVIQALPQLILESPELQHSSIKRQNATEHVLRVSIHL